MNAGLPLNSIETPCFVVDLSLLRRNLVVLDNVQKRTGAKILLAQKAFSMFGVYPMLAKVLHGTCASSPHEAELGRDCFPGEVHAFAAAYSERDLRELLPVCDHIIFNSFSQWNRYRPLAMQYADRVEFGLRVNPEHSEADVPIYDPCAPGSRLGIRRRDFTGQDLSPFSGLHFHTLCEKNADSLERTLVAFEEKFGDLIPRMKWINFGGGHHITRSDYDVDLLCRLISDFRKRYPVGVYLEPGEAVALNTGYLVGTVLDIVHNEFDIAIMDTSAAAHMPDVLEMPYRPNVIGAGQTGEKPYRYRLAGASCLAGDVVGDYSFDHPLKPGDKLIFCDMAHYTMVKTNTFNGLQLPSIATWDPEINEYRVLRRFGYQDFKSRLS